MILLLSITEKMYHQSFLKKAVKQLEFIQEVVLAEVLKLNELAMNKK